MTVKQLAAFYLKFWTMDPDRRWIVTDNAPTSFWKFILSTKFDRQLIHKALATLATGVQVEVPATTELLDWAATVPQVVVTCDQLLASKQAPKTLRTLLQQAYLAEIAAAKAITQTFLQGEISQFTT